MSSPFHQVGSYYLFVIVVNGGITGSEKGEELLDCADPAVEQMSYIINILMYLL